MGSGRHKVNVGGRGPHSNNVLDSSSSAPSLGQTPDIHKKIATTLLDQ